MSNETIQNMHRVLELQKSLNIKEGAPSLELRANRLDRVVSMVTKYEKEIISALQDDFGNRDPVMSAATEVQSVVGPMLHAKKNLKKWMKTEKRKAAIAPLGPALSLLGAKAEIRYQPKGVVGAISPWNFPLNLALAPLGGILSAGNRVMLKPSELTPASSDLTKSMIEEFFDESEIAVFTGDPEVGAAFSGLAFDHLIFTGGTAIAKHVMKAASENLVPLTLELGGKSPVVVGKSSKIKETATRVMQGKTMNAGQICLAPDYALVPEDSIEIVPHGTYGDFYGEKIDKTQAKEKFGIPAKSTVFLFFGNIKGYKGIFNLLSRFQKLRERRDDIYLIIAGRVLDQELMPELTKQTMDANILFRPGFVQNDEVIDYFSSADLCVLPYEQVLTSGAAMLSVTMRCPVLAPSIGILPEVITPEIGLLFDSFDDMQEQMEMVALGEISLFVDEQFDEAIATFDWKNLAKNISFLRKSF